MSCAWIEPSTREIFSRSRLAGASNSRSASASNAAEIGASVASVTGILLIDGRDARWRASWGILPDDGGFGHGLQQTLSIPRYGPPAGVRASTARALLRCPRYVAATWGLDASSRLGP